MTMVQTVSNNKSAAHKKAVASPELKAIKRAAVRRYGVTAAEIASNNKRDRVSRARHLAMFVAYHYTDESIAEITRFFRQKSPGVTHYAINKVETMRAANGNAQWEIEQFAKAAGVA